MADRLVHLADMRNDSALSTVVRRSGLFPPRPIPTYWFSTQPNFGDALSQVIVHYVSNCNPVLVPKWYRGKLLAIGSVMDHLRENDVVWGSGAIEGRKIRPPLGVRFLAVRGPLTRSLIDGDVPEVFGDPAILLPRLYKPTALKRRFELGIVPHFVEKEAIQVTDPSIHAIDVRWAWQDVIDAIVSCHAILSSSLHGLIVAEAYGVPALWISATNDVIGAGFKFRDYYLSTGREPPAPVAWKHGMNRVDRFLTDPPKLDADGLLRSWPTDLTWRSAPSASDSAQR